MGVHVLRGVKKVSEAVGEIDGESAAQGATAAFNGCDDGRCDN